MAGPCVRPQSAHRWSRAGPTVSHTRRFCRTPSAFLAASPRGRVTQTTEASLWRWEHGAHGETDVGIFSAMCLGSVSSLIRRLIGLRKMWLTGVCRAALTDSSHVGRGVTPGINGGWRNEITWFVCSLTFVTKHGKGSAAWTDVVILIRTVSLLEHQNV